MSNLPDHPEYPPLRQRLQKAFIILLGIALVLFLFVLFTGGFTTPPNL